MTLCTFKPKSKLRIYNPPPPNEYGEGDDDGGGHMGCWLLVLVLFIFFIGCSALYALFGI